MLSSKSQTCCWNCSALSCAEEVHEINNILEIQQGNPSASHRVLYRPSLSGIGESYIVRVRRIVARCPGSGIVQRKDLLVYLQVSGKS